MALRIFSTIAITVANAKHSSMLKKIKNVLRTTVFQDEQSSLGLSVVETELAKNIRLGCM